MRTRSLLLALLVAATLPMLRAQAPATAQPEQTPEPAPAPATAEVILADEAPITLSVKAKDTLSVDFPDEEIRTILRNVADLFELNLVVPDTLQGKTSIKLRDVTWRQIFQVTLSPAGYTFIEDGNIIKIVTTDSLNLEPVSTDVYVINYAKAEDIRKSIEPLIDTAAGGRLIVDARSNALVISERPTRMQRVRTIIDRLDRATEQVMIESKFIEVTDRDVKNLGVKWDSLAGFQVGGGPFTQTVNRSRDGGYATGSESRSGSENSRSSGSASASASESATSASNDGNASSVNGAVSSRSNTGSSSSLDTSGENSSFGESSSAVTGAMDAFQTLTNGGTTGRVSSAVFNAAQFNVVLSALSTLTDIKIVSNPTVVTLNNTESSINVGEEYPIPNYTYNQERGTFEVSGFQYRPIGIILKVTPQVNGQGFIRMSVEPEVSQRNGETTFGGAGGASIPIIATRKAKTQVSLKDGHTMGLGGLITSRTETGANKVPVLGNIPVLGRAFRSNNHDKQSTNLLIFITAKTVSADGAAVGDVFDPRAVRSSGLRKDELPGYRDGSDPFAPAAPETQTGSKSTSKP
jgi:type IV pilus assembly protein PilQ